MNLRHFISTTVSVVATTCALFAADSAHAWIRGGIVISEPYGYYPEQAPYYAYPAYPPYGYAPPPVAVAPPPAYPTYSAMPSQEDCREYSHNVTIAGVNQKAYGHACKQADGTWRIAD